MDAAVYLLLHIFGNEHVLSSKRVSTVHTPASAPDLPQYDPRQSIDKVVNSKLTKYSRAYNVDIGGISSGIADRIGISGPR